MLKHRDLIGTVFYMARRIERMADRQARITGISGSQARLLAFLSIVSLKQDIFQKDIEEEFGIRPSSVTGLLQALEQQGLIARESVSSDGRLKKIVLTEKAKEIQTNVVAVHAQIIRQLRGSMTDESLRRFLKKRSDKQFADNNLGVVRTESVFGYILILSFIR